MTLNSNHREYKHGMLTALGTIPVFSISFGSRTSYKNNPPSFIRLCRSSLDTSNFLGFAFGSTAEAEPVAQQTHTRNNDEFQENEGTDSIH